MSAAYGNFVISQRLLPLCHYFAEILSEMGKDSRTCSLKVSYLTTSITKQIIILR